MGNITDEITLDDLNGIEIEMLQTPNEQLLKYIITKYPNNTDLMEIGLKISVIDSLYSTQLSKRWDTTPISQIAAAIYACNLDTALQENDLSVVNRVLDRLNTKEFVHISKYAVIHSYYLKYDNSFCIYDKIVGENLGIGSYSDNLHVQCKTSADNYFREKQKYAEWCNLIEEVLKKYNLEKIPFARRKLDWYLWTKYRNGGKNDKKTSNQN